MPPKEYRRYKNNLTSAAAKGKARKTTVREATEALKKELKPVHLQNVMAKLQELRLDDDRKKTKKKPVLRLNKRVVRKCLKVELKKDKKEVAKRTKKENDDAKKKKKHNPLID